MARIMGWGAGVALALAGSLAQAAEPKPLPPKPSVGEIVKASNAADWRPLDLDNTLYMDLPGGRVVIELAPPFAPNHVANIKALAREHYFDGLVILRSQRRRVAGLRIPASDRTSSLINQLPCPSMVISEPLL